ncbi:MAG: hypothetical protein E7632_06230, partial [Ruminococcaceae bacterium]|nr:hypothetical protein [Oscillospiraceae bacterium]
MNLNPKRLITVLLSVMMPLTAGISVRADERVDVIVTLTPPDGEAAGYAAGFAHAVADYYGFTGDYIYDTLLCGFHLELPESRIPELLSLDGVESVIPCGSFSALEAESVYTSADAVASARTLAGLDGVSYTGDGVTVAVLDDGFDVTHPAFSRNVTEVLSIDALDSAPINSRLSALRYVDSAADFYVNSKIPFRFDYAGLDTDVAANSSHGTHVAGIIGAGSGTAPDCQLLLMKIFDDAGRASDQTLLAALEDAYRLGADVVNLSLGEYAGSATTSQLSGIDRVLEKLRTAGCTVVCASGNYSVTTARGELAGTTVLPTVDYTDYGTLSTPAASEAVMAVTSVDSGFTFTEYFLHPATGTAFLYNDTGDDFGLTEDG